MKVVGEPGPGKGILRFDAVTSCSCGCGAKNRFLFSIGDHTIVIDNPDHARKLVEEINKGFRLLFPETFMISLIDLINEARIEAHLNPVKSDPRLMEMAENWAIQMETWNSTSHDRFEERLYSVLEGAYAGGECVAEGQATPEEAVEQWLNDEPHRVIVLGDYDSVGVGQSGKFWCADFAKLEL